VDPFPVYAKAKESPERGEPLCLRPRPHLPIRPEVIDVFRRELIDHNVAATFGIRDDLFLERPILAQRGRRESGDFTTADERLASIDDGGASFRWDRLWSDGSRLRCAAPRIGFFVRLGNPLRLGPIRCAARLARELSIERARDLDGTEALSAPAFA